MSVHRHTDDSAIARLFAGGRHVRLLIAGQPPIGLALPGCDHFERVVHVSRPGGQGPVIADPSRLPFIEAIFDRALVTTPLPSAAARAELREIWRILSPAGLALLVIQARRRWPMGPGRQAPGWVRESLKPVLNDAMFEVLDWRIETIPDRWHLILVGKRDGLRPAMIGRVEEVAAPAVA